VIFVFNEYFQHNYVRQKNLTNYHRSESCASCRNITTNIWWLDACDDFGVESIGWSVSGSRQ